ncbi:hypothetical protein CGCSCA4_v012698 [Colletotrichum siamense]|nr:hypothetical protein CGCSCA4_v012698 [Colletotrichum siamense]
MFKGDEGKSPNQSRDDGATIDVDRSIQAFCSAVSLRYLCMSDSVTSEASPCLSAHARRSTNTSKEQAHESDAEKEPDPAENRVAIGLGSTSFPSISNCATDTSDSQPVAILHHFRRRVWCSITSEGP